MRRPDARVIGFEPNSFLIEKVKKLYRNDNRVEVRHLGLGSQPGSFDLYVPFYNNYMFDGLASFQERRAQRALLHRLYGYNPQKLEVKKLRCEVKRLDDLNLKPYFIKIDVQGFEYQVLLGGAETIKECKPVLLIETPGPEELTFLNSAGFQPFVFNKSRFLRGTGGLNVFFIHQDLTQNWVNGSVA
jgi:FkbM family methyltransferase